MYGPQMLVRTLVVAASLLTAGVVTAATEVNSGGQSVSDEGFLTADLDCSGIAGPSILHAHGATEVELVVGHGTGACHASPRIATHVWRTGTARRTTR